MKRVPFSGNIADGSFTETGSDKTMGVTCEKSGRLISIAWERPPLNVLDLALLRELDQVLTQCAQDPGADVVVFRGAGERAFSAGVDILQSDKLKLRLQADAFNLSNRFNLINFAGVFSGTALDAPRNFALRVRSEF